MLRFDVETLIIATPRESNTNRSRLRFDVETLIIATMSGIETPESRCGLM